VIAHTASTFFKYTLHSSVLYFWSWMCILPHYFEDTNSPTCVCHSPCQANSTEQWSHSESSPLHSVHQYCCSETPQTVCLLLRKKRPLWQGAQLYFFCACRCSTVLHLVFICHNIRCISFTIAYFSFFVDPSGYWWWTFTSRISWTWILGSIFQHSLSLFLQHLLPPVSPMRLLLPTYLPSRIHTQTN